MLLAARPRVLLLDEPMAGVSVEDVPELVELIRSVHRRGREDGADGRAPHGGRDGPRQRIAVMHHGSLLALDTPEAIMRNETVQRAYLGEAL